MMKLIASWLIILFAGSTFISAQMSSSSKTPEQLAASVARSYVNKDLRALKREGYSYRSVRIVVEHSLGGDEVKPSIEDATFRSFADADRWLAARGPAEYPFNRQTQPLRNCSKGICTYDAPALLHNTLFLTRVTYGVRGGRTYVKTIYFVDGD